MMQLLAATVLQVTYEPPPESNPISPWSLLVLAVVVLAVGAYFRRRRRR